MSASAKGNFLLLNAFSLVLRPTHILKKAWVQWFLRLLREPAQFKVKEGPLWNCWWGLAWIKCLLVPALCWSGSGQLSLRSQSLGGVGTVGVAPAAFPMVLPLLRTFYATVASSGKNYYLGIYPLMSHKKSEWIW